MQAYNPFRALGQQVGEMQPTPVTHLTQPGKEKGQTLGSELDSYEKKVRGMYESASTPQLKARYGELLDEVVRSRAEEEIYDAVSGGLMTAEDAERSLSDIRARMQKGRSRMPVVPGASPFGGH
ncbi:hypothetical protein [Caudoviricetes sp.]|nr:hypothetical protein [Caudoviricetes sp.]